MAKKEMSALVGWGFLAVMADGLESGRLRYIGLLW